MNKEEIAQILDEELVTARTTQEANDYTIKNVENAKPKTYHQAKGQKKLLRRLKDKLKVNQ